MNLEIRIRILRSLLNLELDLVLYICISSIMRLTRKLTNEIGVFRLDVEALSL